MDYQAVRKNYALHTRGAGFFDNASHYFAHVRRSVICPDANRRRSVIVAGLALAIYLI